MNLTRKFFAGLMLAAFCIAFALPVQAVTPPAHIDGAASLGTFASGDAGGTPPLLAVSDPTAWALLALTLSAFSLAVWHAERLRRVLDNLHTLFKRYALVWCVLGFFGICTVFAADRMERAITALIFRLPSSSMGTNGYVRAYWNTSNYSMLNTNGEVIQFTATGLRTGFTGSLIVSNGNAIRHTNIYVNGVLVSTNTL